MLTDTVLSIMFTMKYLRILLLLLLLPLSLHAAITATYDPMPVLFFEPSISPLPANRLVAHLGTLTIHTGGDNLFSPNLLTVNMSYDFYFTGPTSWGNTTNGQPDYQNSESQFYLYAVSTLKNKTVAQILNRGTNYHPIRSDQGNWNVATFVAELYLVSHHPLSYYKLNAQYILTRGTLGSFQVGVPTSSSDYKAGDPLVPINGSPATSTTPILSPGTNPENPIIYGDPPEHPTVLLAIKEQRNISLSQAIGTSTTKVAEAEIQMLNGQIGIQYAVDVIFTNVANTSSFQLLLQNGGSSSSTIPYGLHFNNTNVTPGQAIRWSGLTSTPQSQDIMVTGVTASAAQQALAGYYEDTIIVNIIPVDTI